MATPVPGAQAAAPAASPEAELVRRARAGEAAAFAELVRPHLGMLHRIAARATGSPALAEDAVQEALEVVHRRLPRYAPDTSFRAFVAAVAVRRARTLLRAERRRSRREAAAGTLGAGVPATPSEALSLEETRARVRDALSRLPSKRQRVVLLRLDGGLEYAEIARAVGTTEGSARVLVHHAMKHLALELRDLLGKETPP